LIDDVIKFQKEKVLHKGTYTLFGLELEGFEIHHGISKKYPLFFEGKGTFVHALFDNNDFRNKFFKTLNPDYQGFDFQTYKKETIDNFIEEMKSRLDVERIVKSVR